MHSRKDILLWLKHLLLLQLVLMSPGLLKMIRRAKRKRGLLSMLFAQKTTTVSRFGLSCTKRQTTLLAVALPVMLSTAYILTNTGAFSASASDIYLTAQDTRVLLGDTLAGQILDDSGIWHDCEFEYSETVTLNPGDQNFDTDFLTGLSALRYDAVYTNQGYNLPAADFDKKARIYVDLSCYNMQQIDIPVLSWCNLDAVNNNSYADVAAGSYYDYFWSLSGNSTGFVESSLNGSNAARFRIDGGWSPGVMCFRPQITSGSGSQYSLLTVQASCCYVGNGDHFSFYIVTPFVNDDIVWGTFTTAPVTTAPAGGSAVVTGYVSGTYGSGSVDLDVNFNVDQTYPEWMYSADVTDVTGDIVSDVTTMFGTVPASALASDVSALGDYDSGIIWYALGELFGRHTEIIVLLSGCGALCIFGFVLNRFGR